METMSFRQAALHGDTFTDPTMPGLSVRDLCVRAMDAAQAAFTGAATGRERHREFLVHHDLSHLNREILRDIGLDRNAQ